MATAASCCAAEFVVPEGDTIGRAAQRLRQVLEGRTVERFEVRRVPPPHPRPGERIDAVDSQGKHLLVRFEGGLTLQTHLGMSGSWHVYRKGERWRKPGRLARVIIGVDGWEAVCFSAPTVRLTNTPPLGHLGPDLCRADADLDECVRRMELVDPATPLADVLLDQRICCGVGNVFKSEVCFACEVHPLTPVGAVGPALRRRLVVTAAHQLRASLGAGRRTTSPGPAGSLAVYGRARRPCRRCATPIVVERAGRQARRTYWCPGCQLA
jgi:endonuclease VIII